MEQVGKFTWKIENISSIKAKRIYSNTFSFGGNKWRLILSFPKGHDGKHFSIYLEVVDFATLPVGWSVYAQFRLAVINQIDPKTSIARVTTHEFNAKKIALGYSPFMPLSEFSDPNRGYLINDACLVEAEVCTDRAIDLQQSKLKVETDSDDQTNGRATKKLKTIHSEETLLSLGQHETSPTNQNLPIAAIADITQEDIYTFFTRLESGLASHKIDSSREEAKQALAKIEDALIMAPVNLYDVGKFSPLKKAIKFLCSSDCSSALTNEQKTQLLDLEENLKELPKRAAKAMQDKNLFAEKEYSKLTLFRDLEKSLKIFKNSKAELEQVEQKIAALFKQLDEAQNNKMKILAGWRQNFKTTKDMKMELEALGKEWPVYEARASAAEVEAKIVAAEWSKMEDFVTSLKDRFRKGTN